ncbi:MAG: MBL fold metallo-hydrolase, partial [Candidatus Bathyarchaeia archaeon]
MIFLQVQTGNFKNFTYIIGEETTGEAAVVDPHAEIDRILTLVQENKLKVKYVINTHSHWDHIQGNNEMVAKTGAKVIMHNQSPKLKDLSTEDGEKIKLGKLEIDVFHTPGHCPDEICLLVNGKLMTGDTLFVGECGRTDIPGGNSEQLFDSLNRLLKLDESIEVYPGHDYGESPYSTIGYEKE